MRLLPLLLILFFMLMAAVAVVAMFDEGRQRAAFIDRCHFDGGLVIKTHDGREACLFVQESDDAF